MFDVESVFKEMKFQINERLGSPLFFSFVLSWCAWNYKFLIIVFSEAGVTKTFELIKKYAFPDWTAYLGSGFLLPLATSLLYIYAYPYPARWTNSFALKRQQELVADKQELQGLQLLTLEQTQKLRADMRQTTKKYVDEIRVRDDEIDSLKSELAALQKDMPTDNERISNLPASGQELDIKLNEDQNNVLLTVGKNSGLTTYSISRLLHMDEYLVDYCLDKLGQYGLATRAKSGHVSLTEFGRSYIVENNLSPPSKP